MIMKQLIVFYVSLLLVVNVSMLASGDYANQGSTDTSETTNSTTETPNDKDVIGEQNSSLSNEYKLIRALTADWFRPRAGQEAILRPFELRGSQIFKLLANGSHDEALDLIQNQLDQLEPYKPQEGNIYTSIWYESLRFKHQALSESGRLVEAAAVYIGAASVASQHDGYPPANVTLRKARKLVRQAVDQSPDAVLGFDHNNRSHNLDNIYEKLQRTLLPSSNQMVKGATYQLLLSDLRLRVETSYRELVDFHAFRHGSDDLRADHHGYAKSSQQDEHASNAPDHGRRGRLIQVD